MRRFDPARDGDTIILASHNPGKVREIGALLAPFDVGVVSAGDLGLPEPDETGLTFRENALLKAHASAKASGKPALADDSGLAVDALHGAPGIFSARWCGPAKDFAIAMERVWGETQHAAPATIRPGSDPHGAHFVCVLAFAWPDGAEAVFEGVAHGRIVWPPRGARGFGYDPMFIHDGHELTYGEIDPEEKHAISHRAHAFEQFRAGVFGK